MRFLYSGIIIFYGFLLWIAAFFNKKAGNWIHGRKNWKQKLIEEIGRKNPQQWQVVWFHASSLGEFEQGRPVIEAFRNRYSRIKILLTFFSPSGFEVRKNYQYADLVIYLPLDSLSNAMTMIEIIRPAMVFFIKYDYWYNYLEVLRRKKIPVYFLSAAFRKNQYFFSWYGIWFRKQLSSVQWFFVQDESSHLLLSSVGYKNSSVTGDTRFDRVYTIAKMKQDFPLVRRFCGEGPVFIGGSTWKEDESVIIPLIHNGIASMKFILAPHDTSPERIQSLANRIGKSAILYSELSNENYSSADILIVNTVGILNQLYQYATFAFIGGGFGVSIHNIQEPVTFGIPVFFGPNYKKFNEAVDLVDRGGAFPVQSFDALREKVLELSADHSQYSKSSAICLHYIDEKKGATDKIMAFFENLVFSENLSACKY